METLTEEKITKTEMLNLKASRYRMIMVIGEGTWGVGKNGQTAYENAGKPKKFIVYDVPDGSYVDNYGYLCWNESDDSYAKKLDKIVLKDKNKFISKGKNF